MLAKWDREGLEWEERGWANNAWKKKKNDSHGHAQPVFQKGTWDVEEETLTGKFSVLKNTLLCSHRKTGLVRSENVNGYGPRRLCKEGRMCAQRYEQFVSIRQDEPLEDLRGNREQAWQCYIRTTRQKLWTKLAVR